MTDTFKNDESDSTEEMSFAELFEAYDSGISHELNQGDKINGKIIAIGKSSVYVSTGTKSDGVVDKVELLDENQELPFKVGDTLELYVVSMNESEIILSRALSGSGSVAMIEDAYHSRTPVEGKVTGVIKGGFSVDVMGKRAFCPVSQMDVNYVEKPEVFVGSTLRFVITRYAENGRNIVVSRRELLNEEIREQRKVFLASVSEGDVLKGTVTRLMPYGAFVELTPGVEGMVHISELGWARVEKPEEAVKTGDTVHVKLLKIELQGTDKPPKLSLSMKQVSADPWDTVKSSFSPGDQVPGKVVRLTTFGAFVEIAPGLDGLVHLSEMSHTKRVMRAEEIVSKGDTVTVVIKEIDPVKKRISLSIKEAHQDPWTGAAEKYQPGYQIEGVVEKRERFGLFIKLEPGVTGLMPTSVMNTSANVSAYERLKPGDAVKVLVDAIDEPARRITLAPPDARENDNWKPFASSADQSENLGSMGSVLMEALKKKK
ncbi:MAG: 30S ribosomal protein S1 [Pseudomonadota bacterium]